MSDLNFSSNVPMLEFRLMHTFASTGFGTVYFKNVRVCDFVVNLNYILPEAIYKFSLYPSPHFNRLVLLLDVKGHTAIECHPCDWSHELRGCFGIGSFVEAKDKPVKSLSRAFADSNSNEIMGSLIRFVNQKHIRHIMFTYTESIRVYLTGRY